MELLHRKLERPPASITLVTGPAGSGKSALVRRVLEDQPRRPAIVIDGAANRIGSEQSFVRLMKHLGPKLTEASSKYVGGEENRNSFAEVLDHERSLEAFGVRLSLKWYTPAHQRWQRDSLSLFSILDVLTSLVDKSNEAGIPPVILIDRASELMNWGSRGLIDFLETVRFLLFLEEGGGPIPPHTGTRPRMVHAYYNVS